LRQQQADYVDHMQQRLSDHDAHQVTAVSSGATRAHNADG